MVTCRSLFLAAFASLLLAGCVSVDDVRDRVRNEAEERVDRNIDRAVESSADKTEEAIKSAVRCAVGDEACVEKAEEEGKPVVMTDEDGNVLTDEDGEPISDPNEAAAEVGEPEALRPGEGVWANYDFVPGERPLFVEDFSSDRVGDFPRRLEFVYGNVEVVEWEGGRALRATSGAAFDLALPEALPERFTLEFELHTAAPSLSANVLFAEPERRRLGRYPHAFVRASEGTTGVLKGNSGEGGEASMPAPDTFTEAFVPVRVMADGSYVKVYIAEKRVANVPNAAIEHGDELRFYLGQGIHTPSEESPLYLRDIRVAAGGRQLLYEEIEAEGKVVTRGILFDTGSAQLQPESTPTLQDIAGMLEQHPTLRLRIEGHTDNTGNAQANLRLSQERAEAVKAFLVDAHGIDGSRLEAVGKGEEEPMAPNDTPEGRQQNRRVELVRL